MNLIYAKKFRFPDNSANMIQGVNMVAAFYHCNTNTNAFFSFNDTIDDRNLFLKNYYGINFSAYSDFGYSSPRKSCVALNIIYG